MAAGTAAPKGLTRLPGADAEGGRDWVAIPLTPTAAVPFVLLNVDQGRQAIRSSANRPAAMPIAIRADLKMVWLRFSS
jgi:hypothetical protein